MWQRRRVTQIGATVAGITIAFLGVADPVIGFFGHDLYYLLLLLVVCVTAFFGGAPAGVATLAGAGVALAWTAPPAGAFVIARAVDQNRLALFALVSVVVVWASEAGWRTLERTRRQLAERAVLLARETRAREDLERATRMRDDFLSTLSHELRTPLSSVLGWARLLREKARDEDRHGLEVIERNAVAQTRMIDDLLDLTRLQAGKLRLELGEVDLRTVVSATSDALVPAARRRQLQVVVVMPEEPVSVKGDAARLQQILSNLLGNATKFSQAGGSIEVTLRVERGRALLEVRDHGAGIAPEFIPHVFERFRQQDEGLRRAQGGLGLGLAIARELAELHGARLTAESAGIGLGSTFRLELATLERPAKVEARAERPTAAVPLEALRVLLIDDDPDGSEVAARVLSNAGADVHVQGTAAGGLAWLREHPCDIVASDVAMPEHDGYWLIRKLRKEHGRRIGAVALTALASREDRDRLLAAGFDTYVSKPFEPRKLLEAVGTVARQTELSRRPMTA